MKENGEFRDLENLKAFMTVMKVALFSFGHTEKF